jgi:hypothetical protein
MPQLPRSVVAASMTLALLLLAGCAGTETPDAEDDWNGRMMQLLSDPAGLGGAGGELTQGDDSSEEDEVAEVTLGRISEGEYDVLGVCRNARTVHLAVLQLDDGSLPGEVLFEADIACGATARLPVSLDGSDLTVRASGPADAEWATSVVTPGWEPPLTTFG